MSEKIRQWLIGEAYEDVKFLIYKLVGEFHRRKGGDFDELLAEANYLFVKHIREYNEDLAALSTYLTYRIWHGLIDACKTQWRRTRMVSIDNMDTDFLDHNDFKSPEKTEWLVDLIDELSDEALEFVQCMFNPDFKLKVILLASEGRAPVTEGLREYLTHHRKWSHSTFNAVIEELNYKYKDEGYLE